VDEHAVGRIHCESLETESHGLLPACAALCRGREDTLHARGGSVICRPVAGTNNRLDDSDCGTPGKRADNMVENGFAREQGKLLGWRAIAGAGPDAAPGRNDQSSDFHTASEVRWD
jgi:hypothetical protein